MRYLSVCSGIEAASVAWEPLGWTPVAFSEIEPFPAAVLAHRFPTVPNLGDMTKHAGWTLHAGSVDLLVGGTPCQSFSVAGLRKGLHDPRGGLMLTYLEIAQRLRPRWLVWENVPGVLSSGRGRDFGSFLGALGELGYGWAYRVLDAQWIRSERHKKAVPQRRRRVFVVGCLGDCTAAAAVLFESESVRRNFTESPKTRKVFAADAEAGVGASRWWDGGDCASTLTKQNANGAQRMPDKDNFGAVLQPVVVRAGSIGGYVQDDVGGTTRAAGGDLGGGSESFIVQPVPVDVACPTLTSRMQGSSGWAPYNETAHLVPMQPVPIQDGREMEKAQNGIGIGQQGDPAYTLDTTGAQAVVFPIDGRNAMRDADKHDEMNRQGMGVGDTGDPSHTVTSACVHAVAQAMIVRRLTPRECERLQGFPDDWTLIPWRKKAPDECPDGPRYKALGNSMAVNCMEWIGERIVRYESR